MHIWRYEETWCSGKQKQGSLAGIWQHCGREVERGGGGVRYVTRGQILWGFIGHCKDFMFETQWKKKKKKRNGEPSEKQNIMVWFFFFFLALLSFLPLCRPWVVSGQEWKQSAFLLSPVLRHRPYFCISQFWFHMIIFLFSGWTWDLERRSGCLTISNT